MGLHSAANPWPSAKVASDLQPLEAFPKTIELVFGIQQYSPREVARTAIRLDVRTSPVDGSWAVISSQRER